MSNGSWEFSCFRSHNHLKGSWQWRGMCTVLCDQQAHGSVLGCKSCSWQGPGRTQQWHHAGMSHCMQLCPTAPPHHSWERAAHHLLLALSQGERELMAPLCHVDVLCHAPCKPHQKFWWFPFKELFKGSGKIQVCWSQHSSSLVSLVGIKL